MSLRADERGLIVTCGSCAQSNRIAFDDLASSARCAKCKTALPAPGSPIEILSTGAFDALVAHAPLPILVDCWAPWCGPCRVVAPELEKVASAQRGRWLVVKVNTDELQELAVRLHITSIPALLLFAEGREVERTAGARPAVRIQQMVEDALAKRRTA